ncbi:MAG: 3-keto-5-aminohexanoate cleavage protein [Alphaproteobacteria bacterium]|nr:3-keto-5-aminohexanoate cleavage protein [Alphaproteobacteria bacterium]
MEKLIITVSLTGNVPTKEMTPHVPVTAEEMAADVKVCADAGASLFHVHARDEHQRPTLDIKTFKENAKKIKEAAPNVIIQLSTGARAGNDWNARINPVRLQPEMASFTTGSNNMPGLIYENHPSLIMDLAKAFNENNVKPEIECFENGMISNAKFLVKKGILKAPVHYNFVLGVAGSMAGNVRNLQFMAESVPEGSTWTATGVGKAQIQLATAAILMGGHVRVGLEDNIYAQDGSLTTNLALVQKIVRIAKELGREIATPDEARKILGLKAKRQDRVRKLIGRR